METGTENGSVEPLDAIHAQAIAGAGDAAEAAPAVEAQNSAPGGAPSDAAFDADFCREGLQDLAELYADTTFDSVFAQLEPVAGKAVAERLARKAAMSPALQRAFARSGAKVLEKYGWAQFLGPEGELIAVVLLHLRGVITTRRDIAKIVSSPLAQQAAA